MCWVDLAGRLESGWADAVSGLLVGWEEQAGKDGALRAHVCGSWSEVHVGQPGSCTAVPYWSHWSDALLFRFSTAGAGPRLGSPVYMHQSALWEPAEKDPDEAASAYM